jgi:HD superfamily phosphodiesterase
MEYQIFLADRFISNSNIRELDLMLDHFVLYITKDRDKSHNRDHMYKISRLAIYIALEEHINHNLLKDILITSWLHDVADHKYDPDKILEYKLKHFLELFDKSKLYFDIIQRISYSKEIKYGTKDWLDILGEDGLLVRNIVSDADKLDAIGHAGIDRCIIYTREHYKYTNQDLLDEVKRYAQEKLIYLKDIYIKTKTGKQLAIDEHNNMLNIIGNLEKYIN